jgi:hypothetical protein
MAFNLTIILAVSADTKTSSQEEEQFKQAALVALIRLPCSG